MGAPSAAQIVIRQRWLIAHGVGATERDITAAAHDSVMRAILRDLRDRIFTWVDDARLATVVPGAHMGLPQPAGEMPAQFVLPIERSMLGSFGMRTGTELVTYRRASGVEIWFDRDYLLGYRPRNEGGGASIRSPEFMQRLARALESEVGAPMLPAMRAALPSLPFHLTTALERIDHIYFHDMPETSLVTFFGDAAVQRYRARTAQAQDGAAVVGAPTGNVTLPAGVSAEDRQRVERLLREVFGNVGTPAPTLLAQHDVDALLALDGDPDRAAILARLAQARGRGGAAAQSVADLLATVRQALAIERSPVDVARSGRARHPLIPRPIRGHIRNRSGELVPGMEARFDFVEDDGEDRFAVPMVIIHWLARRTHDVQVGANGAVQHVALAAPTEVSRELTHYAATDAQGLLNDRLFNFRMRDPGVYDVQAVVDHSFYFPASFTLTGGVEVLPEANRHEAQQQRAFVGTTEGAVAHEAHHFDVWSYGDGDRARGTLAATALARPAGEGNTQGMAGEIRQLRALQQQYERSEDGEARAIVQYVRARLVHLEEAQRALGATLGDRANTVVRTWGAYTSRTAGVQSGDLRVVSWLRAASARFEGHLLDHTQAFESENYRVTATGDTQEAVLEALFVALTRSYPEGTLTLRFEVPGNEGHFVQYTRRTDTLRRDLTNVVFSQPVALAVNLASLVVGVFSPLAGMMISVAYNAAQTADDLQRQSAQGTLTLGHTMTSLGMLAIDLLPAVGMSSRFVQLGRTAYYALEATQLAGSMLLVAPQAAEQIARLREHEVRDLARLEDEIRTRRANNPSDAELRELEAQAQAQRAQISTMGTQIIGEMVARQLIVVASGAVIQTTLRQQLSTRMRGSAIHAPLDIASGDHVHVAVGSSMPRLDGDAVLAGLARGERNALAHAGIASLPEAFEPRSVAWGLVELPDGDVMIVRGGPHGVDAAQLPSGVRLVASVEASAVPPPAASGGGAGQGAGGGASGGGDDGNGNGNGGRGGNGHDGDGHDGDGHDGEGGDRDSTPPPPPRAVVTPPAPTGPAHGDTRPYEVSRAGDIVDVGWERYDGTLRRPRWFRMEATSIRLRIEGNAIEILMMRNQGGLPVSASSMIAAACRVVGVPQPSRMYGTRILAMQRRLRTLPIGHVWTGEELMEFNTGARFLADALGARIDRATLIEVPTPVEGETARSIQVEFSY